MFPHASLFSPGIRILPAVYSSLRDWLNSRGANLGQHSSRRVIMTLASSLYEESEDSEVALETGRSIIAEVRLGARGPAAPDVKEDDSARQAGASAHSGDSTAHRVAMRFKDSDTKFSGDIGQYWMEFVSEYHQVARYYNLAPSQKKHYLHNLLKGDAKRYYIDQFDTVTQNFSQAVAMIDNEYSSVVLQNRVKAYLSSLRLSKFLGDGLN